MYVPIGAIETVSEEFTTAAKVQLRLLNCPIRS